MVVFPGLHPVVYGIIIVAAAAVWCWGWYEAGKKQGYKDEMNRPEPDPEPDGDGRP